MQKIWVLINDECEPLGAFSKWEDAITSKVWFGEEHFRILDLTLYYSQEEFEKDWE